jgi:hypothetical protein
VRSSRNAQDCRSHLTNFFEEIFVNSLDDIRFSILHADVEVNHQLGERVPVNQDQPRGDALGIVPGVGGKAAGSDEDATVSLGAVKGTDELLDLRAPNRSVGGVTLRLNVDPVEADGCSRSSARLPIRALAEVSCCISDGRQSISIQLRSHSADPPP